MDGGVSFDRMAALARFDHIEPRVQQHLKSVYSCLFIGLLSAAAGAYVHLYTNMLQGLGLFTGLITLGLVFWLKATPHESKNVGMRVSMLAGIGLTTGLSLGPLIRMAIHIDPSIVPTALLGACTIFGCFSLASLFSRDRKWLYLGGVLSSVLGWMLIASLLNIFFRSQLLFQAHVYIGLGVFCLFVLYDTQMIIEKRRMGDDDYIWHSVDLFFDFIQIFQKLLVILSQKENDRQRKRRD